MKILLVLAALLILYLYLIMPRLRKPSSELFVNHYFAHRGLHDMSLGIPENSMEAFRRAVEAGYGIELDVQLSADGVPVIFHDSTLSRMCSLDLRVNELTWQELKSLSLAGTEHRIPSLAQFLSMVGGRVPLVVEIKMESLDFRIPACINHFLQKYDGPYCIESFHPAALLWFRMHRPEILRGQLSTNFNIENHSWNPAYYLLGKMVLNVFSRPDFISYNWVFRNDLSLRICCRLFGAVAAAWTIRSESELAACRRGFRLYIFEGFLPDKQLPESA